MKRQWLGVVVAAGFATTAVLGAQKPEPAPSAQPKAGTVTMTGCIQDTPMVVGGAAPAIPGRASEVNAAASAKTYYLNNTKMAADAGRDRPAVGTSGLVATGYRLDGDNALITPHLNQQVRVVGVIQQSDTAPAAPGSTTGPTFKVESVTMVAATCEPVK